MAVVGIVPAAGRGERLGADCPKAFVECAGRPLIDWSLDALVATCDRVVVAVPPGWPTGPDRVTGGAVRSASVRAALAAAPEAAVAVVHDAARPLLTTDLVERCVRKLDEGFDGAIAAAPVTDTIKRASGVGRVEATLERAGLWAIQTPQAFRADSLRRALAVEDELLAAATDDAWLVERCGGAVAIVDAPPDNIKVTSAIDLELAARLLRARASAAP